MPQFRLKAISSTGKLIQTEFEANNKKEAQKKVKRLESKNGIQIKALEKKETFQYKVQRPGKPKQSGEQEAYSKEELERALIKLGYKVISINKKLFDFKGGVDRKSVV